MTKGFRDVFGQRADFLDRLPELLGAFRVEGGQLGFDRRALVLVELAQRIGGEPGFVEFARFGVAVVGVHGRIPPPPT
ncbi:MAG: hypothetical protein ABIP48_33010 [Planctomycetota bacterium]